MASFKPTKIQVYPKLGEKVTQDTLYWKNYKAPLHIKEFGAITNIDFSPVAPHNFAVTAFTRIHIYGPFSQEPVTSFTRFKDTAYCGRFRSDGQLLVAGCEDSVVRLFDVSGKVALRMFKGHTKAVHVTDFISDRYQILTGSDDYTCRLWDLPNATELNSYQEHTDYIRCGVASKLNRDLFITGEIEGNMIHRLNFLMISSVLTTHKQFCTCFSPLLILHLPSLACSVYIPQIINLQCQWNLQKKKCMDLDTALETWTRHRKPEITVAVMKELDRRGTLKNALAGRDEQALARLLNFLIGNVVDPRFAPVLVTAAEMILDIYRSVIGQSPVVDRQLLRLQELLEKEIDYQQDLLEVMGMLDTMFASSFPRMEVPCPGISRANGLAGGDGITSRPQIQAT
ncbi:U3 small nucleolar RNA-associated protein 15 homolog [Notothenia coriiceps]|uniref:U3 small nucleolar RNA-associated protein 15 homolog n=1 Tax=Notothenia coriiceps TaxID=8208 RepID=A0A6I9P3A6_9TELE|nr:PREDICTED: U3 small nucleolar RNA-associated protein 15 homolog [Notothenia coriiceps]